MKKKENKPKVKEWKAKLRELEKVELKRVQIKKSLTINKYHHTIDDLDEVESEIDGLLRRVDSIKKVIRNLRRER